MLPLYLLRIQIHVVGGSCLIMSVFVVSSKSSAHGFAGVGCTVRCLCVLGCRLCCAEIGEQGTVIMAPV